jgi:hypothetical protein
MNKDFLDERDLFGVFSLKGRILTRLSNLLTFISVYPRLVLGFRTLP